MQQDYYKTLGVSEDADQAEIKKVFRRLAKKYHPDRNKGDAAAEAKFKELSEAYETLGDEKKRREYDMMRKYGAYTGGPTGSYQGNPFGAGGMDGFDFGSFAGRGPGNGRSFHFRTGGDMGGFEDIFSQIFGGGSGMGASPFGGMGTRKSGRPSAQRGSDMHLTLTVSFMEAINGTTRTIQARGQSKKLKVKIPAGISDSGQIRLRGQGHLGSYGGVQGDLIITVRVMSDQQFERKGNDIYSTVEISFIEAIKGCKKNVKTLTKSVVLTIPPGTQPGSKMRLKGMGLAVGGQSGDQYVEIKVTIPTTLTDKQKRLLDEWEG